MATAFAPGKYSKGAVVANGSSLWLCVKAVTAKAAPKTGAYWQECFDGLIPWPVQKCYADTNSPPGNFAGYFDGDATNDAFPPSQEVMHEISHQYFAPYDGQNVELRELWLWDDNGTAEANGQIPLEVQVQPVGTFDWVTIDRFTGSLWKAWQKVVVPAEISAQRWRFKCHGVKKESGGYTSLYPTQIHPYGRHTLYTRPAFNPLGKPISTQFFSNVYRYTFAPEDINVLAGVRLYYNTNYIRKEGEDGWRFEELEPLLQQAKDAGLPVLPCFLECPVEIAKTYPTYTAGNTNFVASPFGVSRLTADAWRYQAATCFQLAAWGGINPNVDLALVRQMTTPVQPWYPAPTVKVGLGVLRCIGTANEPDQTWHGPHGYYRPEEQAMMLSCQKDGHKGVLGLGYGMASADPTMRQLLGGLKSADVSRLHAMHAFWVETRGYGADGYVDCPVDDFDFHGYANKGKVLSDGKTPDPADPPMGEAPDLFRNDYAEFARTVNELFGPTKRVGRDEYGFSLGFNSSQRAIPIGDRTREQIQGEWILRDGIQNMLCGLDFGGVYQLGDDAGAVKDPAHTASDLMCGIAGRPAWSYMAQLVANTDGYVNAGIVLNTARDPTKATAVKLTKKGAADKYLVWVGNRTAQSAAFKLALTGKKTVTRHRLQDTGTATADTTFSIKGSHTGIATGLPAIYTAS